MAAVEADRRGGWDRKKPRNPIHRPNPSFDRLNKLTALCKQIVEFDDLETIARWRQLEPPQRWVRAEAKNARDHLDNFLKMCEAADASS